MSRLTGEDKFFLGAGAVALVFYVAWIAFVVWAIFSIVSWLVTK